MARPNPIELIHDAMKQTLVNMRDRAIKQRDECLALAEKHDPAESAYRAYADAMQRTATDIDDILANQ